MRYVFRHEGLGVGGVLSEPQVVLRMNDTSALIL